MDVVLTLSATKCRTIALISTKSAIFAITVAGLQLAK